MIFKKILKNYTDFKGSKLKSLDLSFNFIEEKIADNLRNYLPADFKLKL